MHSDDKASPVTGFSTTLKRLSHPALHPTCNNSSAPYRSAGDRVRRPHIRWKSAQAGILPILSIRPDSARHRVDALTVGVMPSNPSSADPGWRESRATQRLDEQDSYARLDHLIAKEGRAQYRVGYRMQRVRSGPLVDEWSVSMRADWRLKEHMRVVLLGRGFGLCGSGRTCLVDWSRVEEWCMSPEHQACKVGYLS
jgi:hypothetical protein